MAWGVVVAEYPSRKLEALLEDGWEPFAAYLDTYGPTIVLRHRAAHLYPWYAAGEDVPVPKAKGAEPDGD